MGLKSRANLAALNGDEVLDEFVRCVRKPLFNGFVVGFRFVALFVFHGRVLVVVNDRVTCGQNCFEWRAARESGGPIGKLVILTAVDNDHRKAVLVAENEVSAMAWSEEAEVVRGGDGNAFVGAFVRHVGIDLFPASEGVRNGLHAVLILNGLETFEPDEPCSL